MLAVGKFNTEDEAIALANETSYGLGAGVHSSERSDIRLIDIAHNILLMAYTDDANQCMRVSSSLEAGTVSTAIIHDLGYITHISFRRHLSRSTDELTWVPS